MALSGSSAELQLTEAHFSGAVASESTLSSTAGQEDMRQQSGKHCSTSSLSTQSQQPLTQPRNPPSSVRSRAAFFEALNSPNGTGVVFSAPASSTGCQSQQVKAPLNNEHQKVLRAQHQQVTAVLQAQHSTSTADHLLAPTASGQELEMVGCSLQEDDAPTRHSKAAKLSLQHSPPRNGHSECSAGLSHRSVFEIQPHTASFSLNRIDAPVASPPSPSRLQPLSHTALLRTSLEPDLTENAATQGSDVHPDGIELQEQGHAEMLEHALVRLRAELAERDQRSLAAASALACKAQECESLKSIVRELTESRSKLVCAKTNLAEKLAEMQHEYLRLMRVADLSRVVSKENVAKTAKAMQSWKQAEEESVRQQHLIKYFKERNQNLKDENLELKERLCLLERLDLLSYSRDSVCMREFKLHALKETY